MRTRAITALQQNDDLGKREIRKNELGEPGKQKAGKQERKQARNQRIRCLGGKVVHRKVKPVAIMFSEYFFYLTAFIDDEEIRKEFDVPNDSFPKIYRIDKIRKLTVLDEKFYIPYSSRFDERLYMKL